MVTNKAFVFCWGKKSRLACNGHLTAAYSGRILEADGSNELTCFYEVAMFSPNVV